MKITIEIPALDRLNELLEKHPILNGQPASQPEAAPAPAPAKTPKAARNPAKAETPKAAEPAPEEEAQPEAPPAPTHTLETLTTLGKKLIAVSSPAVLRAALDEAGLKGRKLGEATKDEYPAIAKAIEAAIAENDLG